jgi:hypothetical protein
MNGIKISFTPENPPKYWKNFTDKVKEQHKNDYSAYFSTMMGELNKFDGILNPLFAYSTKTNTLYFKSQEKFQEFVAKWEQNEHIR